MTRENIHAFAKIDKNDDVELAEGVVQTQKRKRVLHRKVEASRRRAEAMIKEGRI